MQAVVVRSAAVHMYTNMHVMGGGHRCTHACKALASLRTRDNDGNILEHHGAHCACSTCNLSGSKPALVLHVFQVKFIFRNSGKVACISNKDDTGGGSQAQRAAPEDGEARVAKRGQTGCSQGLTL